MESKFLKAAGSYLGVPTEAGAHLAWALSETGGLALVATLPVNDDDLNGIIARMETMRADAVADARTALTGVVHPPTDERMRDEYNGMDKHSKSEFGSFSRYKAWRLGTVMDATIAGKVELPAHVYLSPAEATEQQKVMAIGRDERGNYAIAVEDLTVGQQKAHIPEVMQAHAQGAADRMRADQQRDMDVHLADGAGESLNSEQVRLATIGRMKADQLRAHYVQRTMAAHARLNGADGKPTSNADDFGGVPG